MWAEAPRAMATKTTAARAVLAEAVEAAAWTTTAQVVMMATT